MRVKLLELKLFCVCRLAMAKDCPQKRLWVRKSWRTRSFWKACIEFCSRLRWSRASWSVQKLGASFRSEMAFRICLLARTSDFRFLYIPLGCIIEQNKKVYKIKWDRFFLEEIFNLSILFIIKRKERKKSDLTLIEIVICEVPF